MTQGKVYTKKHLADALKAEGLPHSYPTILNYESKGVIKRPNSSVEFADRDWRFYTEEEIKSNVQLVKEHIASRKLQEKKSVN